MPKPTILVDISKVEEGKLKDQILTFIKNVWKDSIMSPSGIEARADVESNKEKTRSRWTVPLEVTVDSINSVRMEVFGVEYQQTVEKIANQLASIFSEKELNISIIVMPIKKFGNDLPKEP